MCGRKKVLAVGLIVALLACCLANIACAEPEEQAYYFGDKYRYDCGHDDGFSGKKKTFDEDDPHYGWSLGKFKLSGWTRYVEIGDRMVFLKKTGDKVRLSFILEQNIKKLNGDEDLYISEDTNGYDKYFQIGKTNFGHGTLIIRHTDYQNQSHTEIYTDYLAAKVVGADTEVELFEEGDYEVCLDYEVGVDRTIIWDDYHDYEIFFTFSVRNGNCMVFPRDIKTGAELSEKAFTEEGFWLDFAKTRYLDVSIRKEKLVDGNTGVAEDTRFNQPAKDGEKFTDEGIYTITAKNRYTNDITIKTICVGKNDILKAYFVNGLSIAEINEKLEQGYKIAKDGTFIEPPKPTATPTNTPAPTATPTIEPTNSPTVTSPVASATPAELEAEQSEEAIDSRKDRSESSAWIIAISSAIALALLVCVFIITRKKHGSDNTGVPEINNLFPNPDEAATDEANAEISTENDKEGE